MEFEKKARKPAVKESSIYRMDSIYQNVEMNRRFLSLKANVCDLSPALIKKCITGTEQDFILLMTKARDYVREHFPEHEERLLFMFKECVFGYYVLTPFLRAKEVSDIKVYSHDHVVIKAYGRRFLADAAFFDKKDYEDWLERMQLIQRMGDGKSRGLLHCTDRKGDDEFYLRIDCQMESITSSGEKNIHIRKMPKQKRTWNYLCENKMLDDTLVSYLCDRVSAGYGFLISGRGGSGKSTLLNTLIDEIGFDESALVVQESDELYSNVHPQMQFEHTIEQTDKMKGYCLEDELRMGLLQDIDNFIIGEIKGGEALYVFTTALSTGARFFGTIHANDAASSVRRLAHCARYVSDYPVESLEEMLCANPMVLIFMRDFAIDEILEVDGFDETEGRLKFRTMFRREDRDVR